MSVFPGSGIAVNALLSIFHCFRIIHITPIYGSYVLVEQSGIIVVAQGIHQLFGFHECQHSFRIFTGIPVDTSLIIIGKELGTYLIGLAVVIHRNVYQRVIGLVNIILVQCLTIKQGITCMVFLRISSEKESNPNTFPNE